jgi:hypothetical protein
MGMRQMLSFRKKTVLFLWKTNAKIDSASTNFLCDMKFVVWGLKKTG